MHHTDRTTSKRMERNELEEGREKEWKRRQTNKQRHCLCHSCCCCCCFCYFIIASFTQHLTKLHSAFFLSLQMQLDFFVFINVNFFSVMLSWWWCFFFCLPFFPFSALFFFSSTKNNPFAGKSEEEVEEKYYMNIYK